MLGVLLLVVGVQFICMGILAEIQTRTYHESLNKPIYTIRDVLDSTPDEPSPMRDSPQAAMADAQVSDEGSGGGTARDRSVIAERLQRYNGGRIG
jgi:hypothetical protein